MTATAWHGKCLISMGFRIAAMGRSNLVLLTCVALRRPGFEKSEHESQFPGF
ncbi:MAG TPA: hypothetical protein VFL14_08675 [Xanthomonadales bacterium]|nr:hypothetical protein [Xanthomonadales bacterium]